MEYRKAWLKAFRSIFGPFENSPPGPTNGIIVHFFFFCKLFDTRRLAVRATFDLVSVVGPIESPARPFASWIVVLWTLVSGNIRWLPSVVRIRISLSYAARRDRPVPAPELLRTAFPAGRVRPGPRVTRVAIWRGSCAHARFEFFNFCSDRYRADVTAETNRAGRTGGKKTGPLHHNVVTRNTVPHVIV